MRNHYLLQLSLFSSLLVINAALAAPAPAKIHITPQMTVNSLAGRPATDLVVLSNGRQISVGSLRELQAAQQQMRTALPESRLAPALKQQPAAKGTPIRTPADLAAALKRPGTDTVQFPSGRTATVDQLKFLQPKVEKRLGRKFFTQTSLAAPPIKITGATTQQDWVAILRKGDDTLLESPTGKLTTVGDLKQTLAKSPGAKSKKQDTNPASVPSKKR
ncbi:MAG: hypothetical protein KKH12_06360 [Gammaproteobacteria bacterium]|nr:hypothetical protein [Gammaproteobacteria bacterium]MBU1481283.1 hypothetical protein [Gammaproteobacteria bacterium]